ncbi:hypothetical protein DFR29_102190 [Tahibacter aquaticus]|uniref:Uncharacterized protein n=1 Tax=Tahibacter aquaticus TaxID=520092 RepID=A0A4R6Z6X4_9GAMM|nr:hypothetical protein [Tahibacter aquaticus]TDR47530.1 hypothetical protein DFR29_102190 [Tahibacter aquaticus]
MWKLLRNLLLSALVLGIGLKLALWTAAQQQAKWLAEALADWGTLSWSSANGSFGGEIRISGIHFQPKPGFELAALDASALTLRAPSVFWLLKRAVTRDSSVPEQLGVALEDASVPALKKLAGAVEPGWFGAQSLVPFETFACGASEQMSPGDYQSMHLRAALPRLDLDYTHDRAAETLQLRLQVHNVPFASFSANAELQHFSPRLLGDKSAREALRIASAELDYTDEGNYLDRRNKFCAKQTGLDVDGFVQRHLDLVQERLKEQHMVPAEGVVELYRQLLLHGGAFKLLSLPRSDIAPAQYDTYDPEEVMRWLNLTARHNNAPPVLFKVFFLAEPVEALAGIDRALVHDPLAEPEPEPETVVVRPEENPVLATTRREPPVKAPPLQPPVAASTPVTPLPAAPPVVPLAPARTDAAPRNVAMEPLKPARSDQTPAYRTSPLRSDDPRISGLPSAPPPPPGTTAALVYQGPRIDRLPEASLQPRPRPFSVVAFDSLAGQLGSRVTLITSGGKEIEGKIVAVSKDGVTIQMNREGGQARLVVERRRILEIRVIGRG